MIRISGVARKNLDSTTTKKSKKGKPPKSEPKAEPKSVEKPKYSLEELSTMKTGYEKDVASADAIDASGLQDELDALDFGDSDESDLDDDELDLR